EKEHVGGDQRADAAHGRIRGGHRRQGLADIGPHLGPHGPTEEIDAGERTERQHKEEQSQPKSQPVLADSALRLHVAPSGNSRAYQTTTRLPPAIRARESLMTK